MVKKVMIAIFIICIAVITFLNSFNILLKEFAITARTKEFELKMYIQSGTQLIDDLALHGKIHFENQSSGDSKLYSLLKNDEVKDIYHLDAIGSTPNEKLAGNLTGIGKIPTEGIYRDEINLALEYNNFFSSYFKEFPDIAWLYYTSENNFMNLYPWTPSKDQAFSKVLKSMEFYKIATPENDPTKARVWTSIYLDSAGKGLMVTLSKPIYKKDKFMGVVSIDLTSKLLTKLIDSEYETYLFDNKNIVLANNINKNEEYSIKDLKEYIKLSKKDTNKFNNLKKDSIELVGYNFCYISSFNEAPWNIILIVPIWLIIAKAALATLPLIIISILLLISIYETGKRRKSEQQYSAAIKTTMEAFWLIDIEGKFLEVNYAACEMFGYTSKEYLNMNIKNMLPENRREGYSNHVQAIRIDGSKQFEAKHICKNGSILDVEVSVTYLHDIDQFCCFIRNITERKQKEKKIAFLSYHDILTGLYNRAYFEEECSRLDTEHKLPISIIMGDVNGLKLTNDAFGHLYGDKLLCVIAEILKDSSRQEDIIARIGGDEFCILLLQADHNIAQSICERVYNACENKKMKLDNGYYNPSVSLGFATMYRSDENISDIMRDAENSMYKRKLLESKSAHSSLIASIRTTMFERSNETREHADRLSSLAKKLGEALELPYDQLSDLELLGTLHDVGKIGIDSQILSKSSSLNGVEWEEIKKHPEIGYRIANASPELSSIADGILGHHERWDGGGYPQGISGKNIPLSARIIAVVDSFDAMTHDRVYHKAISLEEAKKEIEKNTGKQFDPIVVQTFLSIVSEEDI